MNKDLWDVYLVQEIYEELSNKKAIPLLHVPAVDILVADENDVAEEEEEEEEDAF